MKNKITVLSSCHKKDVLALVIIRMSVLQDTLPILYFKALPTKNILRHWRVFACNCLYPVLFKDFQCVDLYNSVIANNAIWRTTKKWELGVDPKSCRGYSRLCGNFILHYGFWFSFKAIMHPLCLKMFRSGWQ